MKNIKSFGEKLANNLEKVIIGKRDAIDLIVVGLLCQGHILIEDVPGVGKTMLARSLARSIGCSFNRLQFTPDMLPSDVTGVSIYNQAKRTFEFHSGPIFAQIVLVDEINRATPKTSGRSSGSDGGAAGYCGWEDPSIGLSIHGPGNPKPDRIRGDFPASRSPARPLPDAGAPGLSDCL